MSIKKTTTKKSILPAKPIIRAKPKIAKAIPSTKAILEDTFKPKTKVQVTPLRLKKRIQTATGLKRALMKKR